MSLLGSFGVRERVHLVAPHHESLQFCAMVAKAMQTSFSPIAWVTEQKKTHYMTPRSKVRAFLSTPCFCKVCCQMRRDMVTNLMQVAAVMLERYYFYTGFFGRNPAPTNSFIRA